MVSVCIAGATFVITSALDKALAHTSMATKMIKYHIDSLKKSISIINCINFIMECFIIIDFCNDMNATISLTLFLLIVRLTSFMLDVYMT